MTDYINLHTHTIGNNTSIVNLFPEQAQQIIDEHPHHFFSVGLHPCFIGDNVEKQLLQIAKLSTHQQVLAIGEIGLDKRAETPLEKQIEIFEAQIHIAEKAQKPIIIHCVKAYSEILSIKKELRIKVDIIFHGFRGKPELAKQIIKAGGYISVGKQAIYIPETIKEIPINQLFIETDEGNDNIEELYKQIAEIKEISTEKLAKQIQLNVAKVTNRNFI